MDERVRYAPLDTIAIEILDRPALTARRAQWDDLLARSASPNPFAAAAAHEAHAAAGIAPAARFVAASRGGRLVGLLPLGSARIGLARRPAAWTSPYAVGSTPLVDADDVDGAVDGLLEGLRRVAGGRAVAWPLLSLDTPVGAAVRAALARRGWPHALEDVFDRPVLERRASFEDWAATLPAGRRKGLRRLRRRLEEQGTLAHVTATAGEGLAGAIDAFLALEAAGWKGRAGTALAATPATAAFARLYFAPPAGPVTTRADLLTLDGRPIAASLALVCGDTAHLLKTAYDEELRRFAPGLVLEEAIVRALHADGFARRLDSAASAGHVLEEIYPDRERVGDLVLATGGMSDAAFRRLLATERLRRAALAGLKRLRARLGR